MLKKLKQAKEQLIHRSVFSLLANGTVIKGDVLSEGEIHFDGAIEGNISAQRIILGEHSKVAGMIQADSVEIYGTVVGGISARAVKLGSSAQVKGDITQNSIVIESGAVLEGRCRRLDDPIEGQAPKEDLLLPEQSAQKDDR